MCTGCLMEGHPFCFAIPNHRIVLWSRVDPWTTQLDLSCKSSFVAWFPPVSLTLRNPLGGMGKRGLGSTATMEDTP